MLAGKRLNITQRAQPKTAHTEENTMTKIFETRISRRAALGAGLATAGILAMPSILRAQDRSIKVGVYGGYFKDSFDKHIFPEFTKATGIAVESIAEPTGE